VEKAIRVSSRLAAREGTGGPLIRLARGETFAHKFRLEREIASGGMGTVWRARNLQLDVPVAVKVMAPRVASSAGFVARFEREAKAAAQIRSPHVVTVHEHGVHEGLPYMIMELLEGEDLHQRLKRETRLSLAATARVVRDVCRALHRAHDLGIVHRDLKPANVFLARDLDEEVVKVLDFGIAKLTNDEGSRITSTGEMMGTPHYMSPEQVKAAKHVDHRADLWAVGAIAYRCLTGQLPFSGSTLEIVQQILHERAPAASSVAPHLPRAIDAFFDKAMAPDIARRFQSARELSDALAAVAASDPSAEVPPPPVSYRDSERSTTDEAPTVAMPREVPTVPDARATASDARVTVPEGEGKTLAMGPPEARPSAPRQDQPATPRHDDTPPVHVAPPDAQERTRPLDVGALDLLRTLPWSRHDAPREARPAAATATATAAPAAAPDAAAPPSSSAGAKSAPSATMVTVGPTVLARRSRLVWAAAAIFVAVIAFALWAALHGAKGGF
jgi:serine/threonine-protein kinase